jgi:hypothetical protein
VIAYEAHAVTCMATTVAFCCRSKGTTRLHHHPVRYKAATLTEAIVGVAFRREFSYLVIMAFDFCTARRKYDGYRLRVERNAFAEDFNAERERRPIYKKYLSTAFTILILLLAVVATLNDIANLASN